jgi:hypothetical protein
MSKISKILKHKKSKHCSQECSRVSCPDSAFEAAVRQAAEEAHVGSAADTGSSSSSSSAADLLHKSSPTPVDCLS